MAETIEALYSEAYALVEQGICYDEVGQRDGALSMYEKGLQLIDRAGQMAGVAESPLYQKMLAAREHVLYRLKDLRLGDTEAQPPASLPSPFDAVHGTLQAFGDTKNADEVFMIPGGCQIFQIVGDDTSVPSYPGPLRVFRFTADSPGDGASAASSGGAETPPAFLQVADWVYPLVPGRSPVLSTQFGAYIFPNPTEAEPELCVGLLLPADVGAEERAAFETELRALTALRQASVASQLSVEEQERLAAKLAKLLVGSGQAVAWGVKKTQQFASNFMDKEASKAIERSEAGSQPKYIDPRVQTSVHYLRRGTKVAVKVSGYLVNKVGAMASYVGSRVATSATKAVGAESATGGRLLGDAVEVVKGGVAGAATVYVSLEEAAKTLARDIANSSVRYVEHKYGEPMAAVTMDGMKALGHGGMAVYNVAELGPKAIAKRTAKQAGISLLSDMGGGAKTAKPTDPSSTAASDAKPQRPPPPAPKQ